jgi:hypothetical protein
VALIFKNGGYGKENLQFSNDWRNSKKIQPFMELSEIGLILSAEEATGSLFHSSLKICLELTRGCNVC